MRWIVAIIFLLFLSTATAHATQYNISVTIDGNAVKEEINIRFSELPVDRKFTLRTVEIYNINVVDQFGPLNYSLRNENGSYVLEVKLRNENLFISFNTDDLIFQNGELKQVFFEFTPGIPIDNLHTRVWLPKGFVARKWYPPDGHTSSDGQRICIAWDITKPSTVIFSVLFEPSEHLQIELLLIPSCIAIGLATGSFVIFKRFRKRRIDDFLASFMPDERAVVELLIARRVAWQNKLEHELKFSRPKMTRIVKKLEAKGLIKKERRGRTNKLIWTKKLR
jgi:uncharacterized membrane protein